MYYVLEAEHLPVVYDVVIGRMKAIDNEKAKAKSK